MRERLRHTGKIETPLDAESLEAAIDALAASDVEAVAICFLHAYANPVHEEAARERLAEKLPGVYVTVSSEVLPHIKEYERVSTTAVNAYVGPVLERYLSRLDSRLREEATDGTRAYHIVAWGCHTD